MRPSQRPHQRSVAISQRPYPPAVRPAVSNPLGLIRDKVIGTCTSAINKLALMLHIIGVANAISHIRPALLSTTNCTMRDVVMRRCAQSSLALDSGHLVVNSAHADFHGCPTSTRHQTPDIGRRTSDIRHRCLDLPNSFRPFVTPDDGSGRSPNRSTTGSGVPKE